MRPKVIIFNVDGNVVFSTDFNEIIPLLFNKGYRMLLISDKGPKAIDDYLKDSNLCDYFEYIPSVDSVMINFEEVVNYFNTEPGMMVYVGDRLEDLNFANSFGVNFIAVASENVSKDNFRDAGCMIILNSISDLNSE